MEMEIENASSQMQLVANPTRPQLCYQILVISIMGAMRGQHEDADIIQRLVETRVSDPVQYRLLCIMAQAMGGEATYAIESAEARLAANPEDDQAKVVMAAAMLLTGHPDGKFTVDNVLATSLDQPARQAALGLQEFAPVLLRRAEKRADCTSVRPA